MEGSLQLYTQERVEIQSLSWQATASGCACGYWWEAQSTRLATSSASLNSTKPVLLAVMAPRQASACAAWDRPLPHAPNSDIIGWGCPKRLLFCPYQASLVRSCVCGGAGGCHSVWTLRH